MGHIELSPTSNNIAFGSGKECWGFTLKRIAEMYSKRFGIEPAKLESKFWGDNFYDPKKKVWRTEPEDPNQKRAFSMFVLDPICKLAKACIEMDQPIIDKIVATLEVKLAYEEKSL